MTFHRLDFSISIFIMWKDLFLSITPKKILHGDKQAFLQLWRRTSKAKDV